MSAALGLLALALLLAGRVPPAPLASLARPAESSRPGRAVPANRADRLGQPARSVPPAVAGALAAVAVAVVGGPGAAPIALAVGVGAGAAAAAGRRARVAAAAAQARRDDHIALADAQRQHIEAVHTLRAFTGDVASLNEQRRRLKWAAGGGLLAGCLLWAVLPGLVARSLPASWHLPERIAARTVREPTLWDAGIRLMRAGNPEGWQAIVDAADMRQDNRDTIAACEQQATKAKEPVRCTIRMRYRQP